jgi:hypothetical protein
MKLQPGRIPAISLTWAMSMTYLTLAGQEFSMSRFAPCSLLYKAIISSIIVTANMTFVCL